MTEVTTRLDHLAEVANGKHREAYQAAMTMLYAGIAAGDALIEARTEIAHGGWMKWCAENLEFGTTTACSYMLVSAHQHLILAEDGIDTMQKAIRYLKANKLTSQTRIDDERIQEIRDAAQIHGVNGAARLLGETFGTVQRYAAGNDKTKRVKPPGSGTRQRVAIDDEMIERMAEWLCARGNGRKVVTNEIRDIALSALQVALDRGTLPQGEVIEQLRTQRNHLADWIDSNAAGHEVDRDTFDVRASALQEAA